MRVLLHVRLVVRLCTIETCQEAQKLLDSSYATTINCFSLRVFLAREMCVCPYVDL